MQHIEDVSNVRHACDGCDAVFDTKEAKDKVGMPRNISLREVPYSISEA